MNHLADYLNRQAGFSARINSYPVENTGFIVVIPCYNEPGILKTLGSLAGCSPPSYSGIEVVLVLNASEKESPGIIAANEKSHREIIEWTGKNSRDNFNIHCIRDYMLPVRYAGPGLARKIGMDEAVHRFKLLDRPGGIICSLDADSLCDDNYFTEIEKATSGSSAAEAGTIYFEHPVQGDEFPPRTYRAATLYELNMRYYYQALRWSNYPYVHHSLGSAFFVSALAYAKAGGMNKRLAGEDFYFLQKLMPGVHSTYLTGTRVIPSSRPSERVLFGTGPWIKKFQDGEANSYPAYEPGAFADIRKFIDSITLLYDCDKAEREIIFNELPPAMKNFLDKNKLFEKTDEIISNTSSRTNYLIRFFVWFNGLMLIRFLNHAHKSIYKRKDVLIMARQFLERKYETKISGKAEDLLKEYRRLEKTES